MKKTMTTPTPTMMATTTIDLMDRLLDTLDAEAFVTSVQQFDGVTRRQCLLKARRELRKLPTVRLHGAERTRSAAEVIRQALDDLAPAKAG